MAMVNFCRNRRTNIRSFCCSNTTREGKKSKTGLCMLQVILRREANRRVYFSTLSPLLPIRSFVSQRIFVGGDNDIKYHHDHNFFSVALTVLLFHLFCSSLFVLLCTYSIVYITTTIPNDDNESGEGGGEA